MTREPGKASGDGGWLKRRLVLGLAISFLLVAGLAVWSYWADQQSRLSAARRGQSRNVLRIIDETSALLAELDAAQRGYVVTGNANLFSAYQAAAAKLRPHLHELRQTTAGNPRHLAAIPILEALLDQKIGFVEQVAQRRRDRGIDDAAALMATMHGERLKTRINRILNGMRAEEGRKLAAQTDAGNRWAIIELVALGAGVLIQFGFLFAVYYLVGRDIVERRRSTAALSEQARLATFTADVGTALTRSESLPQALEASAAAMVKHLGAATATIWVQHPKDPVLERRATAGVGVNLPDPHDRIAVGEFRIGRIAEEGVPRIIDLTQFVPEPGDKGWARQQGMVSFAGHPLMVAGRSLGVVAMFSREPITGYELHAISTVADSIALAIDRARAADSLRTSETLTRSIIEGMLDALVTTDAAGHIRSINPAAEKLFGYGRDELIGQPLSRIVPGTGGVSPEAYVQMCLDRLTGGTTKSLGRRKDGAIFPFELALFEFWTSDGRHFGGAIRDLSERQEIDRLKREFVSTVSHELRTPLTSIRGALGLVTGGAAGILPAQAKGLLDIALKNCERLARLVNDILDMEKIEAGRLEFQMEELVLEPLLEASVEGNRAYAEQFGVGLTVENHAPGVRILADADRMTQVLTNLLSNAVKYSPKGGTVRLVAGRRGSIVRLEVHDRGPGIPEEFRSRIFGRFQQADSSDTRQKGGTGLGLAITRLIVEQLGGTVDFETEVGRGTTFRVDLPVLADSPRPGIVHVESGNGSRARILHVEDDPDLTRIVRAALSEFADVDVARGLREARERLAGASYDVVVLDVGLPDGSGLELEPLLARAAAGPIPFVFFSAHEIPHGAAGGAQAVLVKSRSTVSGLVEAVKSVLAGTPQVG